MASLTMESVPELWTCTLCGKPAPDKIKQCACPTRVVSQNVRITAWCIEPYTEADELRDLRDAVLQSTTLADFMAVQQAILAIRACIPNQEGGKP